MARELSQGDVVYLRYEEEDLWHERVLTGRSLNGRWAVCTPDYDHYVEAVEGDGIPLRVGRGGWHLANGLGRDRGEPVYRFDPARRPRGARLRALFDEAIELVRVDALDQAVAVPVEGRAELAPEGNLLWICLVSPEGAEIGQLIRTETLTAGRRDGSVHVSGVGDQLRVFMSVPADLAEIKSNWLRRQWAPMGTQAASSLDARILPIERNSLGQRFRDVRSAVSISRQEELSDFPLDGPRTARWWTEQISRTGMTPGSRHKQWRHENAVDPNDSLCRMHELISDTMEFLICVDQLDGSNLSCAENLVRQAQYIEHEIKKKAENKGGFDPTEYFLGRTTRLIGGAILHPDLVKWVSEKAARDSAILKEERKAREERAAAKAGPKRS
eukprot:6483247-Amphidinium_carterae.1